MNNWLMVLTVLISNSVLSATHDENVAQVHFRPKAIEVKIQYEQYRWREVLTDPKAWRQGQTTHLITTEMTPDAWDEHFKRIIMEQTRATFDGVPLEFQWYGRHSMDANIKGEWQEVLIRAPHPEAYTNDMEFIISFPISLGKVQVSINRPHAQLIEPGAAGTFIVD